MKNRVLLLLSILVLSASCESTKPTGWGGYVPVKLTAEPASARKYLIPLKDWEAGRGSELLANADALSKYYVASGSAKVGNGTSHVFVAQDGQRMKQMTILAENGQPTEFHLNLDSN